MFAPNILAFEDKTMPTFFASNLVMPTDDIIRLLNNHRNTEGFDNLLFKVCSQLPDNQQNVKEIIEIYIKNGSISLSHSDLEEKALLCGSSKFWEVVDKADSFLSSHNIQQSFVLLISELEARSIIANLYKKNATKGDIQDGLNNLHAKYPTVDVYIIAKEIENELKEKTSSQYTSRW